ncbi:MAG TPA: hypothetical protein VNR37_11050 [Microbacteriaceae bacterium]|nr:hypothetical protein [Microbacteriaceae bacterium]
MTRSISRTLTTALGASLAVTFALGLAACAPSATPPGSAVIDTDNSSTAAIESYIEAGRAEAEAEAEVYSDIYQDFSISAENASTLVYRYVFRNQLDPAQARSDMEAAQESLESAAQVIFAELEGAGVTNPVVKWVYVNADGTEITTFSYAK